MSAYPTRERYAAAVGTTFRARTPEGDLPLVLESADAGVPSEHYESFSLVFSGPMPVMAQATFELAHEQLGNHDVFLVPIASDGASVRYQAVFNLTRGE